MWYHVTGNFGGTSMDFGDATTSEATQRKAQHNNRPHTHDEFLITDAGAARTAPRSSTDGRRARGQDDGLDAVTVRRHGGLACTGREDGRRRRIDAAGEGDEGAQLGEEALRALQGTSCAIASLCLRCAKQLSLGGQWCEGQAKCADEDGGNCRLSDERPASDTTDTCTSSARRTRGTSSARAEGIAHIYSPLSLLPWSGDERRSVRPWWCAARGFWGLYSMGRGTAEWQRAIALDKDGERTRWDIVPSTWRLGTPGGTAGGFRLALETAAGPFARARAHVQLQASRYYITGLLPPWGYISTCPRYTSPCSPTPSCPSTVGSVCEPTHGQQRRNVS